MRRLVLFTSILLLGLSIGCARHETPPVKDVQPAKATDQSGKAFDIKADPIRRVRQWQPTEGGSIMLTRGVSMKMINGSMTGLEAEPDFELAVIKLNVTRLSDGASLSLDDVSAYDDKGKKFPSAVGGLPALGKEASESREFAFAVPAGALLKKIELTKDVSIDLN